MASQDRGGVAQHGLQRGLVVGHDAPVVDDAAGLGEQRGEHRGVALADLPRPQRRPVGDQLVAGRQHGDPGRRDGRSRRRALMLASTPATAGETTVPAVNTGRRRGRRRRRPGRTRPARAARDEADPAAVDALAVLDHRHRVGAVRQRRAGHDPHRLAGRRRPPANGSAPAATSPTTRQLAGTPASRRRARRSRRPPSWRTAARPRAATTSAASTRPRASAERDRHRRQRRARLEHEPLGVLEIDHSNRHDASTQVVRGTSPQLRRPSPRVAQAQLDRPR